ncbi:hypothetical protein [Vallitalea guaymasensis]|uniref:hypothetical protein n=1 Tax=Vallitalea guaymasensis TaxID=1185412 RepID=UPI002352A066|nr:hypothetical protein [Vallitalea guaymasensis]
MSLVVARKIKNNIIIMSDTKLTYKDKVERNKITSGTIKTVIIGKEINLSFAGETLYAKEALNWIEENQQKINVNDLIVYLENINKKSEFETDFILCIGDKESVHSKIIQIKDGQISNVVSSWIGSITAFNKYQEAFHSFNEKKLDSLFGGGAVSLNVIKLPSKDNEFNEFYIKNFYAMNEVIEDSEITEVDGFIISSVYTEGSFHYMGYFYCFPISEKMKLKDISANKVLSLGSREEGSYAISVSDGSRVFLPIFITHGNIGILYKRNKGGLMNPHIYYNISYSEFTKLLKKSKIKVNFIEVNIKNNFIRLNNDN